MVLDPNRNFLTILFIRELPIANTLSMLTDSFHIPFLFATNITGNTKRSSRTTNRRPQLDGIYRYVPS